MGSWYETCMISNLPIIDGEKIKLMILTPGIGTHDIYGQSGYVYSTGILCPAFLPITGVYGDYGMIAEPEKDWNYELIETHLKKKFGNVILTEEGEIKDWNLMDLLRGIERGNGSFRESPRYKGDNDVWIPCQLSTVMIRQDVWDLCVKIQEDYEDYWNPDKMGKKSKDENVPFYIRGSEWANRTFDDFIYMNQKVFDDPMEQLRFELSRSNGIDYIFKISGENSSMLSMYDYKILCKKNKDDKDFMLDIKNRWIEYKMVEDRVSELRKGWMIQPGCGSQDGDWSTQKKFYEGIVDICDKKIEEDNEW